MKVRTLLFSFLFLFLLSCEATKKETKNSLIDVQTIPKTVGLFGEGIISTPLYERDMAISSQGNELVYTLGDYKQTKRCLVSLKKQNGDWVKPEILNISGKYQDIEPFYSPNGNRLYFASNRPIYNDSIRTDYNIWYSDKNEDIWSEPVPLDSIINTKGDEFYPALSKNGNLYFTATREDGIGREDLFMSEFADGEFLFPEPLPIEINTPFFEFNAFISPNDDFIIFSSFGRDDGFGGGDLYISEKDQQGKWKKAKNMGRLINSDKLDYCPFVDWEFKNFYFTSERMTVNHNKIESVEDFKSKANSVNNGLGNIYKIGFKELQLINK
ncbi:MAG: TolB family protein [Flavobacteriales bacterium]